MMGCDKNCNFCVYKNTLTCSHILKEENEKLKDALIWVIDQFEKVLSSKKAGSVPEALSYAKSLLK